MPTDTQIPHQWSAADIVGEALPALSFLCYVRYDQSLDLLESLVDEDWTNGHPVGTFSEVGPKHKKTKKSYIKLSKKYKPRKLKRKAF
jgi:hypothetical protein